MDLAPAYEQWYAKTIKQGKQEGITEGKRIGITEGKKETARRMLRRNMSLEEISDLTDLTIAQLQALPTENQ
jgi:predicted transposase/invertase (TIGR01784 family)